MDSRNDQRFLLTRRTDLRFGPVDFPANYDDQGERRGVPFDPLTQVALGAAAALDADGYAQAQAVAAAGNLTLNGVLEGEADIARGVSVVSAGAGDTTQTVTVTGTDHWGQAVRETITLNGTTTVNSKKAFLTVTTAAMSAATAGNVSLGTSDVLGLPYRAASKDDVVRVSVGGAWDDSATVVAGVDTTPSATTGDVRGTVDTNAACNGSTVTVWMAIDPTSKNTAYGKDQYAG